MQGTRKEIDDSASTVWECVCVWNYVMEHVCIGVCDGVCVYGSMILCEYMMGV